MLSLLGPAPLIMSSSLWYFGGSQLEITKYPKWPDWASPLGADFPQCFRSWHPCLKERWGIRSLHFSAFVILGWFYLHLWSQVLRASFNSCLKAVSNSSSSVVKYALIIGFLDYDWSPVCMLNLGVSPSLCWGCDFSSSLLLFARFLSPRYPTPFPSLIPNQRLMQRMSFMEFLPFHRCFPFWQAAQLHIILL